MQLAQRQAAAAPSASSKSRGRAQPLTLAGSTRSKSSRALRSGRSRLLSGANGAMRSSHFQLVRVPDISTAATAEVATGVNFQSILVAILDGNKFLGDGSKTAVATAALLAGPTEAKVSVLLIREKGTISDDPQMQRDNLSWHLRDNGCKSYTFMEEETSQPASVVVGDVADKVEADLVVVASEAIHSKYVDANQLAEFVSCPLHIVP